MDPGPIRRCFRPSVRFWIMGDLNISVTNPNHALEAYHSTSNNVVVRRRATPNDLEEPLAAAGDEAVARLELAPGCHPGL